MRIILKFEIDPFPQTQGITPVLTSSGSVFLNFHGIVLVLGSAITTFLLGLAEP